MSYRVGLIEAHYEEIAEELKWDRLRFDRLCSSLQLTHDELAAYIRCRPCDVRRWRHAEKFPPTVELHLTLIARCVWPHDPGMTVFPSLFSHAT